VYESLFCIVDLHAMSTPTDPVKLHEKTLEFLALYIACGLDADASTIFVQSQNPHHTELAWILNCCTAYGDLTRMTQFKDKTRGNKHVSAGLLNYPILMAADILLYRTDLVPIGDDQVQHLELSRSIARRFNAQYGEVFKVPEKMTPRHGGRIRNLLDPTRKMDKSSEDPRTYIALLDTPDEVRSKIMKAKTDARGDFDLSSSDEGITNLVTIMAALTDTTPESLVSEYAGGGYARFKRDLVEVINETLEPIRGRYEQIRSDKTRLSRLLEAGKDKAVARSVSVISKVRVACGLL
jgi:tryptophanyl-tRNA synthetase